MFTIRYSLSFLVCALFSCGSFESVTDTAKLVENLENQKSAYENSPCDLTILEKSNLPCAQDQIKDTIRIKAIKLLVAYGNTLEKFVKDADFKPEDQIGQVLNGANDAGWTSLSDDEIKGSKTIAKSIVSIVTNSIKRKALRTELKNNNEAVQQIVKHLVGDLDLRIAEYIRAKKALENYYNNPDPDDNSDKRVVKDSSLKHTIGYAEKNGFDNMSYSYVSNMISRDVKRIQETRKMLLTFGIAHNILAQNFEKIGTKSDPEVVEQLFNDLSDLFDGFNKIKKQSTTAN